MSRQSGEASQWAVHFVSLATARNVLAMSAALPSLYRLLSVLPAEPCPKPAHPRVLPWVLAGGGHAGPGAALLCASVGEHAQTIAAPITRGGRSGNASLLPACMPAFSSNFAGLVQDTSASASWDADDALVAIAGIGTLPGSVESASWSASAALTASQRAWLPSPTCTTGGPTDAENRVANLRLVNLALADALRK